MFGTVLKEINNGLDILPRKFSHQEIGNIVGLERNTVGDILKSDSECTKFSCYLQFAKLIDPRNYIKRITSWAPLFRKTENVKLALEFLLINKEMSILTDYINTLRIEGSSKLNSILDAYELIAEFRTLKEVPDTFIKKIANLKETVIEAKFLKKVLATNYHSYFRDIKQISESLGEAESFFNKMKGGTLKEAFELRLLEVKSTYLLFNACDQVAARECCERILRKSDFFSATYEANVYYKIGMSYFYDSPDMCLFNLRKAVREYKENGREDFVKQIEENEINLAKVYWGKVTETSEVAGTPSEAHYLVTIGRTEDALRVISGLDADSPFTRYYKGMAENNPFLLLESLKILRDRGNAFYAKLPTMALEKHPEASGLIKLL